MPIYEQYWREGDYVPKGHLHLRDLPKNHLLKIKQVKFEFMDYKVYQQFACLPYERMIVQCANNYGLIDAAKNLECNEIMQFFKTCIQTNAFFGHLKKTQPEFFQSSKYSRERPNFQELGL